jgi:hypothetical protein
LPWCGGIKLVQNCCGAGPSFAENIGRLSETDIFRISAARVTGMMPITRAIILSVAGLSEKEMSGRYYFCLSIKRIHLIA